ncbi:ImmA/IrrE family metallo-endopeptidase [Pseudoruegeria sp. SHC-113]|uniref:ImmA/IrrE family metallo-endopeptidase n=1 Tax=Pseudoruegeria sp. SHC-113 TaxID=2855439 RepID=UPI0021BB4ACD|nr:ImmA/IrrE family metallo-endopeptidase [Pseudoruegeria sp. SHC-113]MCT8162099.1 ImmA/IrrE family metallo-endopeptidase [Pseudoruegeria sp. SHC-113]
MELTNMVSKSPRRPQRPGTVASQRDLPPPGLLDTPEQVLKYYERMGLPLDSSIPIETIIKSNNELDLSFKDLGINDAYIKRLADDRFEIAVNSKHHPNRQRFSMAHEYAHYLLHRGKIDSMPEGERILHRNGDKNSIEYQANTFAAELLMPEVLVRRAFRVSHGNLTKMALELGVSKESLKYRLSNLGYRVA